MHKGLGCKEETEVFAAKEFRTELRREHVEWRRSLILAMQSCLKNSWLPLYCVSGMLSLITHSIEACTSFSPAAASAKILNLKFVSAVVLTYWPMYFNQLYYLGSGFIVMKPMINSGLFPRHYWFP